MKTNKMILPTVFPFLLLLTLLMGTTIAQGNILLQPEPGKGPELKTVDKRVDNFRVPVEDPNFWPARGRRGNLGRGTTYENPISPDVDLTNSFQCQKRYYLLDAETPRASKYSKDFENVDVNSIFEEIPEDCYDLPQKPGQSRSLKVCKAKLKKNPNQMDARDFIWLLTNKTEGKRHKQQSYGEIPWFNSEYMFMKPDTSNGEKEKKQDVFWVSRGKKSSK